MLRWRRMERPLLGSAGVINPQRVSVATQRNPIKPLAVDFWNDVLVAARAGLPKSVPLFKFFLAYYLHDAEDDRLGEIERNVWASRIIGARVHSLEQRIGREFINRGIWPIHKYMNPPRPRPI